MILSHPLILASRSPRRQDLLRQAGYDFNIVNREVSENFPETLSAIEAVLFITKNKAAAYKDLIKNNIVICADTVVVHDKKILGKPLDKQDAFNMLKILSGKSHQVITGVVISGPASTRTFTEETKVVFNNLDDSEIYYYIENFSPFDKAGSYGIQEWIGLVGIKEIHGSYFNVVGLPIHRVYHELKTFFT